MSDLLSVTSGTALPACRCAHAGSGAPHPPLPPRRILFATLRHVFAQDLVHACLPALPLALIGLKNIGSSPAAFGLPSDQVSAGGHGGATLRRPADRRLRRSTSSVGRALRKSSAVHSGLSSSGREAGSSFGLPISPYFPSVRFPKADDVHPVASHGDHGDMQPPAQRLHTALAIILAGILFGNRGYPNRVSPPVRMTDRALRRYARS